MSSMAAGIPIGLAMGMGTGIAIGMGTGMQSGRRQASKDVAAWLQQQGIVLTGPDGVAVDAQALLAVVSGTSGKSGKSRNRGNRG